MDEVFVLIGADPGGSSSEGWWIGGILLEGVVIVAGAEHVEVSGRGSAGLDGVSHFVKLVVHDLTKVDEHILLQLDLSAFVDLDTRSVDNTHVSDEVTSVLADNHELTFPKLLVVGNLVVVRFTLTDLEDTGVSLEGEGEVLELLSVHRLEGQVESVLGGLVSQAVELLPLQTRVNTESVV